MWVWFSSEAGKDFRKRENVGQEYEADRGPKARQSGDFERERLNFVLIFICATTPQILKLPNAMEPREL